MGKRRLARELALQMLYQHDLGGASPEEIAAGFSLEAFQGEEEAAGAAGTTTASRLVEAPEALAHALRLVAGTVAHLEEIDALIRRQAEHWRLERMPPVDRNVLRLAIYELLCEVEVPKLVVVDEAVDLAKKYGAEQSGRFVNGLLDGLLKAHAFPGSLT
ncbi:MAG: transcription antitermination factor NusB [Thermoanaerobaculia bacterium]|nr:transcription antitermination factor NusB [Thermoanaerobaculia bacterium]MCZ7650850.1 transcription antitermination factor NusB [Thermoanaerobaculia bacterium]